MKWMSRENFRSMMKEHHATQGILQLQSRNIPNFLSGHICSKI